MVVTTQGLSGVAVMLGSLASNRPLYCGVGTGSLTVDPTVTGLSNTFNRRAFTAVNGSTTKRMTFITDFDAVAMSGNALNEVDLSNGSPAAGDIYAYYNLGTAVTFDGTAELRIEIEWEVF